MEDAHDDYDTTLYTTIENDRAKTAHMLDPFAGFMFGSAFDGDGNLEQQQFEKYGDQVRLFHGEDELHLEGL